MKHTPSILAILITIFVVSQLMGLLITYRYLDYETTVESGSASFKDLPFDTPRPDVDQSQSFIWIMAAVIVGTLLVLAIIKFRKMHMWKLWFFMSVTITLTIAFAAFIPELLAVPLAVILALGKIYRPGFWVHNASEVFIYGGLAAILTPIINLFSVFMLLLLISVYDMYSVWKSEHMVTMAKSQTSSKLFAGLMVPYDRGAKPIQGEIPKGVKVEKMKTAILGGGDVGFPLIFAGVVMKSLLMYGVPKFTAIAETLIIVVLATLSLFLLLRFGKKDRFYPAMPYLSAGCFAGYIIIFFLNRMIL